MPIFLMINQFILKSQIFFSLRCGNGNNSCHWIKNENTCASSQLLLFRIFNRAFFFLRSLETRLIKRVILHSHIHMFLAPSFHSYIWIDNNSFQGISCTYELNSYAHFGEYAQCTAQTMSNKFAFPQDLLNLCVFFHLP